MPPLDNELEVDARERLDAAIPVYAVRKLTSQSEESCKDAHGCCSAVMSPHHQTGQCGCVHNIKGFEKCVHGSRNVAFCSITGVAGAKSMQSSRGGLQRRAGLKDCVRLIIQLMMFATENFIPRI